MERQTKLALIGAILSDLVYHHSPAVFDAQILIDLGLMMRYSYTGKKYTKFVVFTKARPSELEKLRASSQKRLQEINYLKTLQPNAIESEIEWFQTKRRLREYIVYSKDSGVNPGEIYTETFRERVKTLGDLIGDNDIFVVFRGTHSRSLQNILTDLRFFKTINNQGIQTHGGFSQAYLGIQDRLRHILEIYREKSHRVFVGHSLGGALALLAGSDPLWATLESTPTHPNKSDNLQSSQDASEKPKKPETTVITYGAPKITNQDGADKISSDLTNYVRVANMNDPVTKMPPDLSWRGTKIIDYVHVPSKWKNTQTMDIQLQNHSSRLESFRNHSIQKYIKDLCNRIFSGEDSIDEINSLQEKSIQDRLGWSHWEKPMRIHLQTPEKKE